jgi:hypothetical protein
MHQMNRYYSAVAELFQAWRSFATFEERAAQLTRWSMSSAATKNGAKMRQDLNSFNVSSNHIVGAVPHKSICFTGRSGRNSSGCQKSPDENEKDCQRLTEFFKMKMKKSVSD